MTRIDAARWIRGGFWAAGVGILAEHCSLVGAFHHQKWRASLPVETHRASMRVMRTILVFLGVSMLAGCGGANEAKPVAQAATKPIDTRDFFGEARGCFSMRELGNGETFEMGGDECGERSLPASTFKIPNAIIALDTGVLKDEKTILKWDGKKRWNDNWNRDHALPTAMWHSVVPFFQEIATQVGAERYRTYLSAFHYGNADPSGDVTLFWLENGRLSISPREQVSFLASMYEGKLRVSTRAVDLVKATLELRGEAKEHVRDRLPFVDRIAENVVLSGKTGSAMPDSGEIGPLDVVGWFVGAVERDGRRWVFACRLRSGDGKKIGTEAARIAYEILKSRGMV
ncbi:MAG: class D beta-lactamase [Polyangiaceae bacterium]|nr:class D beta-lactamase [Polyangiaceae bacterium]